MTFDEKIGGNKDNYIKLKEVEQNSTGNHFAIVYLDDGKFRLRTFGEKQRLQEEIQQNELDINSILGIDTNTMPIDDFPEPFISCTFINNELIFVNLFHTSTLTHHHFFYNYNRRKITTY